MEKCLKKRWGTSCVQSAILWDDGNYAWAGVCRCFDGLDTICVQSFHSTTYYTNFAYQWVHLCSFWADKWVGTIYSATSRLRMIESSPHQSVVAGLINEQTSLQGQTALNWYRNSETSFDERQNIFWDHLPVRNQAVPCLGQAWDCCTQICKTEQLIPSRKCMKTHDKGPS